MLNIVDASGNWLRVSGTALGNPVSVISTSSAAPIVTPVPPVVTTVIPAVTASCPVSAPSASTGQTVTWTAQANGGNGTYAYQWSNVQNVLYPDNAHADTASTASATYTTPGTKGMSLYVSSGGKNSGWINCPTVNVTAPAPVAPAPTVTISTNPASIAPGSSGMIVWSSTNATTCQISGPISANEPTSGAISTGTLTGTGSASYTMTCTGQAPAPQLTW